jgi:hypothetical protein
MAAKSSALTEASAPSYRPTCRNVRLSLTSVSPLGPDRRLLAANDRERQRVRVKVSPSNLSLFLQQMQIDLLHFAHLASGRKTPADNFLAALNLGR